MLPKKNRVSKKDVDLLFKGSKFISSSNLTFKFILTKSLTPQKISFIAPKSVTRLAVKRNLLRRRGYTALKKYLHLFPLGIIGVFVFKKYQDNVLILEDEIKNTLNKIN